MIKSQVKFTKSISTLTYYQVYVAITLSITKQEKKYSMTEQRVNSLLCAVNKRATKSMHQHLSMSFLNTNGILILDSTWKSVSSSTLFSVLFSISTSTKFTLKEIWKNSTSGNWLWHWRWCIHSAMIMLKWLLKVLFHISVKNSTGTTCPSSGAFL